DYYCYSTHSSDHHGFF
nr:immunoglobulin light chain junction region [Macaca mulatta]MOX34995.1 immunoglobulin light chain junction region [Macaca mulatta]MOX36644.1 immunoglobulin light chain junction region [Macaca mulatta]MOX36814.1 immunoglobulin light chain junction region [Macaca mulatta]MOX37584.1 immunoglobulin light chain junction region [Macaca mulatta]